MTATEWIQITFMLVYVTNPETGMRHTELIYSTQFDPKKHIKFEMP